MEELIIFFLPNVHLGLLFASFCGEENVANDHWNRFVIFRFVIFNEETIFFWNIACNVFSFKTPFVVRKETFKFSSLMLSLMKFLRSKIDGEKKETA